MKRTNSFLLTATLVCCAILFSAWANAPLNPASAPPPPTFADIYEDAQPGSFLSIAGAPNPWLTGAVKGWMGKLPDAMPLNAISIPGTHDSFTAGFAVGVATQSWSIAEQLDAGIRYLDLRLKEKPNSTSALEVFHGIVYLGTFDEVLNTVKTFLNNNSTETIIMHVQQENGDQEKILDCWDNYLTSSNYSNLFQEATTNRTLGPARGKIVLEKGLGHKRTNSGDKLENYGFWESDVANLADKHKTIWSKTQNFYKVYAFAHEQTQNSDWATFPSKIKLSKEYVSKAISDGKGVVNFLSGSTGMTPYDVAVGTNSAVYQFIDASGKKRYLGLIIMDWPGDRMIYRIIKSNFDFEADCNCPAKTFRGVDSYHTWVEFRMPQGKGGEVRSFPAGAYHRYVFPACHRTWWTDTKFRCNPTTKAWEKVGGDFGANGECSSNVPAGCPEIVTGDK